MSLARAASAAPFRASVWDASAVEMFPRRMPEACDAPDTIQLMLDSVEAGGLAWAQREGADGSTTEAGDVSRPWGGESTVGSTMMRDALGHTDESVGRRVGTGVDESLGEQRRTGPEDGCSAIRGQGEDLGALRSDASCIGGIDAMGRPGVPCILFWEDVGGLVTECLR